MTKRWQYPAIQGPVLPDELTPEVVYPDKYWQQPSEPSAHLIEIGALFAGQIPHYTFESKTGPGPEALEWFAPLSEPPAHKVKPDPRSDLYAPHFMGQRLHEVDQGTGPEQLEWLVPLNEPPAYKVKPDPRSDLYAPHFSGQRLADVDTGAGPAQIEWFVPANEPPAGLISRPHLYSQLPGRQIKVRESITGPGPEQLEWFAPLSEPSAYRAKPPPRPDLYAPHFVGQRLLEVDTGTGPEQLEWLVPLSEPPVRAINRPYLYAPHLLGQPLGPQESVAGAGPTQIEWFVQASEPVANQIKPDSRADLYVPAFTGQRLGNVDEGAGPEELEWFVQASEPYPRVVDARGDLYNPAQQIKIEVPDPAALSMSWHAGLSEPVSVKTVLYQAWAMPVQLPEEVVTLDKWFAPANEPPAHLIPPGKRGDLYAPHFIAGSTVATTRLRKFEGLRRNVGRVGKFGG